MKITQFEDLKCWKEARVLVNMVYQAVRNSSDFQKHFRLVGQFTDATISSMSNIAEGFSRRSNREFVQFLFVSKSSATEVQSVAYVAMDQKYISPYTFEGIYNQAEKVSKMSSGLITLLLQTKKPQKLNEPNEPNKAKNSTNGVNSNRYEKTFLQSCYQ
jgi:four helix bundle protein